MHKSIGRRVGVVLIAAAAAAAFNAPTANAALTSCGGAVTDPAGDGYKFTVPRAVDLAEQAPHYDIRETFFKAGDGVLQAHIKVTDMAAEPDEAYWPTWNVTFEVGDVTYEANARLIEGSMTYYYWKFDGRTDENTGFEVGGEVVEGPNGGVIIEIPTDNIDGYSAGMTLNGVWSFTQDGQAAGATPHGYSDRGPDADSGTSKAAKCSSGAPAPPTGGKKTPPPPAPPAGSSPPPEAEASQQRPAEGSGNSGPANPAAKKSKKKKATCARKARKIKNKAKRKKALKRCKKASRKKARAKKRS